MTLPSSSAACSTRAIVVVATPVAVATSVSSELSLLC
jgi:hypothetical protein